MRVNIKLVLDGKDAKQFEEVRTKLGILNATDVLRFLIKREADKQLPEQETPAQ